MGIWEFIGSTAETVKRNAPDATPLKSACRASYDYGFAAFTKVDRTVRIDGLRRLGQWVPDDETKSKIWLYSTKFTKNAGLYALQEGYKLIPGGVAFSKIMSNTLNDVKRESLRNEKLKVLEGRVHAPKQHSNGTTAQESIDRAEIHRRGGVEYFAPDARYMVKSIADKAPDDVIRVFMMKEFIGNRFLDDLMVPKLKGRKKPE